MGRLIRLSLFILVFAAAGLIGAAWLDYTAPGPLGQASTVVIPRGSGTRQMGRLLEEAGVIRHAKAFEAALRARQEGARLRAGEYAFVPGMSLQGVIDKLVSGETVTRRITIPEGLTTAEVLRRLSETEGLTGDPPPVKEGQLLPETYQYSWGDSRAELVERMRKSMEAALSRTWEQRKPGLPLTSPEQLLTLASVVEKETGVAAERPRVAAVFLNRLSRGMKLQSDPTVIYAVTNGAHAHDRPLTREDLKLDSPYNTYRVDGLPPGPIANPGLASLQAVVNAPETDELYFVADGSGGHAFSRTLADHNRNVLNWRRVERERNGAARDKDRRTEPEPVDPTSQ